MSVQTIIEAYLREQGFDGLYAERECACELTELMPCEDSCAACRPGYRTPCDCGDHDWHIGPTKGEANG